MSKLYFKPVFSEHYDLSPVDSKAARLEQLRQAIFYPHESTFKELATPFSGKLKEVVFRFITQFGLGCMAMVSGTLVVFLPIFQLFELLKDIFLLLTNNFSRPYLDRLIINLGLFIPRLLSGISALIGGALTIVSSPFVAIARLVEMVFPKTFEDNQATSNVPDLNGESSNEDTKLNDKSSSRPEVQLDVKLENNRDTHSSTSNAYIEVKGKGGVIANSLFRQPEDNDNQTASENNEADQAVEHKR